MITMTVFDLLRKDSDSIDTTDHYIYLVRNNQDVFYVGTAASVGVIRALLQHLGLIDPGKDKVSKLGQAIIQNYPQSYRWQIDLFTVDDCTGLTYIKRGVRYPVGSEYGAAWALRQKHKPFLNRVMNPNRRMWPEIYGPDPWDDEILV